jgi:hypothetical protein
MNNNQIAPHEILELHELLNTNILNAKKLTAAASMVQDENLKKLMDNSLNTKKARIQELQNFINTQMGGQLNNQNNNQNNSQQQQ